MKSAKKDSNLSDKITCYYPAFLDLKGKKVVVCGGGKVAERKVLSLIKTGGNITVISPWLTKRLEKEKQSGRIRHIHRQYRKGDLKKAFLVIAATDSRDVNELISREAVCLLNVVDTPDLCNFVVPSVVNRWPLILAVSTSGVSPALSRSIRKELESLYGMEICSYLKFLKRYRRHAMKLIHDKIKRKKFLVEIASERMLNMLRKKGLKQTKKVVDKLFIMAKGL